MIYLLLLLFLSLVSAQYFSGLLSFSNGNQQRSVSSKHIDSPLIIYSISDMSFNDSLSLDITYDHIVQASVINFDTFTFRITTKKYNVSYTLGLKYLVTQQLKGWKQEAIQLNFNNSLRNWSTGDILDSNIPIVKQGYFVTGFSNPSLLDSIIINKLSTQQYIISFTPNKFDDWVKFTFIRIDTSPLNGCPANDIISNQLSSDGKQYFQQWDVNTETGVQIIFGVTSIYRNKGSIKWDSELHKSIVSNSGSFSYYIIQIDTQCKIISSNYLSKNTKHISLIQSELIAALPTQAIQAQYSSNNILDTFGGFKLQNSSSPPYYLPTISKPILNGSGFPLPIYNSEIRPVIINPPTKQQQQAFQILQTHFEPTILRPNQAQKLEQNELISQPVVVATLASQQIIKTIDNPIIQQDGRIESIQDKVSLQRLDEVEPLIAEENITTYRPVQISAWKILGFVILIWIAISIIALPILCCALRKSKVNSENIEMQDRIQPRATDVRLISNDVISQPSQAVGQLRNRNSLRSEITVEIVAPKQSSQPNSDVFRSDKGSSISPIPSTIKQQVLTYEQLKAVRAQSLQNPQSSLQNKGKSIVQNSEDFQNSKSDKVSSSKISNSPSSNLISLTQQTQFKQPTEQQIQYQIKQQQTPQQKTQNILDIHLSEIDKQQNQIQPYQMEQNQTSKDNQNNNSFKQEAKENIQLKQIQNEESNYDFQSCLGDQSDVFTKKPSKLSEFNAETSHLESKINNLFGEVTETNNQKQNQNQTQQQQQQKQKQQEEQEQQVIYKQKIIQQHQESNQQQQKQSSKGNDSFDKQFKSQASKFSQIKQTFDKKQPHKQSSQNQNQSKVKEEQIEYKQQQQQLTNQKQQEPSSPEEIEQTRKKSSEQQN